MSMDIRFDTVVIGAENPRRLADFYKTVFGFFETTANKDWGDPADSIRLVAPDFEGHAVMFLFAQAQNDSPVTDANDLGYAHLCFETLNMRALMGAVVKNGGEIISTFPNWKLELGLYGRDPEGNIVEAHVPMPESKDPKVIVRALGAVGLTVTGLLSRRKAKSRFLHVNIVTTDWKRSVEFYQKAFRGHRVGKPRDYDNEYIRQITGMPEHVRVTGEHVSMPGNDKSVTTLEIFTYSKPSDKKPLSLTDRGVCCIDFTAHNDAGLHNVVAAGASVLSQNDSVSVLGDPDGNLIRILSK